MSRDDPREEQLREKERVGLCADCTKVKKVVCGKGSTFYLCTSPDQPKYPELPRRVCTSHETGQSGAGQPK